MEYYVFTVKKVYKIKAENRQEAKKSAINKLGLSKEDKIEVSFLPVSRLKTIEPIFKECLEYGFTQEETAKRLALSISSLEKTIKTLKRLRGVTTLHQYCIFCIKTPSTILLSPKIRNI